MTNEYRCDFHPYKLFFSLSGKYKFDHIIEERNECDDDQSKKNDQIVFFHPDIFPDKITGQREKWYPKCRSYDCINKEYVVFES